MKTFEMDQFPINPGIYQMLSVDGTILYVGKARNLRKRLESYFRVTGLPVKTEVLMRQVHDIKTIITANDTEAFLLESNLIKEYRPRYNVLLRDDKSYPYLYLSTHEAVPRLDFYRGTRKEKGRYFGPYPTVGAVRDNLALLQKLFRVRQCSDTFFKNRSRPCLQYQIKRCTAPCVKFALEEEYAQQIEHVILFLEGKSSEVIEQMELQMDKASLQRDYERAAYYRDQIVQLRKLQETQCISGEGGNIDVIAVSINQSVAAVSVLFIRQGLMLGKKVYFPQLGIASSISEVLSAFITQYYLNEDRLERDPVDKIILSDKLPNKEIIETLLHGYFKRKVTLSDFRGALYRQWQDMAKTNAQYELLTHLAQKESVLEKLSAIQAAFHLKNAIERIECFDISHTAGEATVASCVVYDKEGAKNKEYRRFNISDITLGDDYAAMKQALMRRYKKMKMESRVFPDIILIDGGQGQLKQAIEVFEELQLSGIQLIAVSKGPARKPGEEQLWLPGRERPMRLAADSSALHLIQFIRDEAHRFAITFHRKKRSDARTHSKLEDIEGVGATRRRDLLRYFGGMQELRDASHIEIAKVPGISSTLAKKIYEFLH